MQRRRARRVKKTVVRGYSNMDYAELQKKKTEKPSDRSAARAAAMKELKNRKAGKAGKK